MSEAMAASRLDEFSAAIRDLEPGQIVETQLERFAVDGATPDMAVEPANLEQLARVLTEAHEAGLGVLPFGGGVHMALGNHPEAYDVALPVTRMDRVLEYEPADLTVTVEAGIRLTDLQARLAQHGQFLPLDPPGSARATIGGILATNASGPLRHGFGTARDWLLGIRVVHGDGTVTKGGGRVVKNVAGYDMPKLYIGSLGTLGVIAEATFKVAPLPKSQSTIAVACDSPHGAGTLLFAAHDAGLALHAAELLSPPASYAVVGEPRWMLLLRAAGGMGAVDRTLRDAHELAAGMGAHFEIRDGPQTWRAWDEAFSQGELALRINVLPARVPDAIEVLDRRFIGSEPRLSATVSAGVIRAVLRPTSEARAGALVVRAREIAERFDGAMIVEAAPPALKRQIDVFGPLRPDFTIMKRLKEEFDPARTLAPGRFVGRL